MASYSKLLSGRYIGTQTWSQGWIKNKPPQTTELLPAGDIYLRGCDTDEREMIGREIERLLNGAGIVEVSVVIAPLRVNMDGRALVAKIRTLRDDNETAQKVLIALNQTLYVKLGGILYPGARPSSERFSRYTYI